MRTEVLTTKITPPPRQKGLVDRSRLLQFVRNAPLPRLTLISAPAGFGKSTCAREIAAAVVGRVAWYAVDGDDDDPLTFFSHVAASLKKAVPELPGRTLQALESSAAPSLRSVLTIALNDLSLVEEPVCMVLDDFHLLSSSEIHRGIAYLLDHMPSEIRMVIATREDPDLPLSRLRARGDIVEIRSGDLRFTGDEISDFLRLRSEAVLDPQSIHVLETRTEGWVAGLQMATISINRYEDPDQFLRSFGGSNRHIVDYLTAEALSSQPEAVQRFLIRSSILTRLTGALCDALAGDEDVDLTGQEMLEYLERVNLFVTPLDDERRWYRMHPLFAELLRNRLEGDLRPLHKRAALWLVDAGYYGDALTHAVRSEDPRLIRLAIDGGGIPLYAHGKAASVIAALENVPQERKDGDGMLWVHQAWATWTAYRSDDVPPLLARAERLMTERSPDRVETGRAAADNGTDQRRIRAHVHALRANLATNTYEYGTIRTHADRALEILEEDEGYPRASVFRAVAFAFHISDDRPRALDAYRRAVDICRASGYTHLHILCETGRAIILERQLALSRARQSYLEVLRLAGDPDQPVTCEAHAGLGRIAYARNQLDEAAGYFIRGRNLARKIQGIDSHIAADVMLCRVHEAAGAPKRAQRELERIKRDCADDPGRPGSSIVVGQEIHNALAAGDLAAAESLIHATMKQHRKDLPWDRIRLHIAKEEIRSALEELETLEREAVERGWTDLIVKSRILTSVALAVGGTSESERAGAREVLQNAWVLLAPEHAVRPILDEGPIATDLFREMTEGGGEEGDGTPSGSTGEGMDTTLSRRELEVLRLVAEGLPNDRIAERLFISLSTVKGHNSRIFEKLGAANRIQAVAVARKRGFIGENGTKNGT